MDKGSRQNHRSREERAPSVGFYPLVARVIEIESYLRPSVNVINVARNRVMPEIEIRNDSKDSK
jgi:hypothetical protein